MNNTPLLAKQYFKQLGFSDKEIAICNYLFVVKTATAKEISEKTATSYASTAFVLHNLQLQKIVLVHKKSGVDIYTICSARKLSDWINHKKGDATSTYDGIRDYLVPYVTELSESLWKPSMTYYEGREGIREIYQDMLKTNKTLYSWIDLEAISSVLGDYMEAFIKQRIYLNIETKAIMPRNKFNENYDPKGLEKREIRWVDKLPLNGEVRIYGNKIAQMTFDKDKPIGYVIEGGNFAEMQKEIFRNQWDNIEK